jgi:hypothetical protein
MSDKMWFGIPGVHMQYVPCPLLGSTITRNRYIERMQFENGGGDARRSPAYQMEYNFSFSAPAHELDGIDAFNRFASGFYGDDLIELAHPAAFETNLFSAVWASPGLIESGWKNIATATPTFANTNVTSYNQPQRTATWTVTDDPGIYTKKFTIAIPPTHTLNIGASGIATGTAVVRVLPIKTNNSFDIAVDLTLLSKSASTRMNETFSGSEYQAVHVYITRTSTATSTISITSMMAQLYLTGTTPTLPTNHYQGEGSTGLVFADEAIIETYSYMHPPRKGISTTLVEVGAWR